MAHAGMTWVPLRENYFATPLLSAKEKAYLVRKSCEAAQEVVERARSTGGPVQWRHVEKFQDVQIYAGQPRGAYGNSAQPADIVSMCGVTSVAGSVKEVASLFDLSTTRAMKEFSMEHRELFFDAIVLYNLSPRTKEKPLHQVTAKWIAVKSPRGLDDRDFCYLECQDKFVDSHGRKGWVLCLHSIKLPGCDDLTREFGFVRGSFYHSGLIVVETDRPGYVDVIHMLQMNFKKNSRVSPSFMRDRVAFVAKVRTMMRNKRLNEQRYLSDLELVPKKYRSRCTVCQDSFSLLLLRKMNCRKCGEVVCGACSKEFDVKNAKFLETVKLRICMHCFQLVTTAPKSQIPMLEQSRASTAMSLLGYYEDDQRASFLTQVPSSAAELAETAGQQRRTKIFLQSLQRPRSSARRANGAPLPAPPMTTEMYYQTPPQPRGSHPLRPSQLGAHPSHGSVLDNAPYSRETATYAAAPQSAASIFDRPYNGAMVPQSVPHNYEYHHHAQDARSRSNTREFGARGDRVSARQQNQSHNSAYQYAQPPPGSYEYPLPPPPVAYPDSLRGSESKRRDSASSESSADSIDIDADEGQQPPPPPGSPYEPAGGDRGRSNSRLSSAAMPPPPSYYSEDVSRQSMLRGRSPSHPLPTYAESVGHRSRSNTHMSAAAPLPPPPPYSASVGASVVNGDDDDSDGSVHSSDDCDFDEFSAPPPPLPVTIATDDKRPENESEQAIASSTAAVASMQLTSDDSDSEHSDDVDTEVPPVQAEAAAVPALLPPFRQRDDASTQQSAGTPGERTSEAPEGHSARESEHAYDLRDSELGLNTTMCDTSFLDSDMRQFHDQSWFIKSGQLPRETVKDNDKSDSESDDDVRKSVPPSYAELQPPAPSQPRSSESSRVSERSSVSKPRKLHVDAAFAVSRPLLTVNNHMTSPTNSYEGMPSLYAKPREKKASSRQFQQYSRSLRPGTIALNNMDSDPPPPSYTSSVSSVSSKDKENYGRQDSNASVSSSSSSSAGKKSVTIADDASTKASPAFFGAQPDDVPPLYQPPRAMPAFSPTATYEVPTRSKEETQELLRKMSSPSVLASPPTSDGSKSEPEHESIAAAAVAARSSDDADRDLDFGDFDASIEHDASASATEAAVRRLDTAFSLQARGDDDFDDEEEEEEDALLSARSLYKTFGNTRKLTNLVGGNDAFQRTFDKIQASFDMLSSDDESDNDVDEPPRVRRP